MWNVACLSFIFLMTIPTFPQAVSPIASAPVAGTNRMVVPPPVSVEPYRTDVGLEAKPNYLRGGISFGTSYIDNLYAGSGSSPLAEKIYSVSPTLDFEQTRSTRHATVRYSPSFTFYQPTSALNEINQDGSVGYQVRLTPHSEINLNDSIQYRSTPFYIAASGSDGAVSGAAQTVTPGVIIPYAKNLNNVANGEFTLQTGRSSMIGVSGSATTLHFPDLVETSGVYDSNSRSGSGFYSRRLSDTQYFGVLYIYAQTQAFPINAESETRLQSVLAFYSIYPKERLSLSASVGPQNYRVSQAPLLTAHSWAPSLAASIGWRGLHTSFAASYSQTVTGGGGLAGAYHSRSAIASAAWEMSRTWTAHVTASYAINENVTPHLVGAYSGGHGIFGTATVGHSMGRQFNFALEYSRLHLSYSDIPAISSNPDSNRVAASITWRFMRPLGQ